MIKNFKPTLSATNPSYSTLSVNHSFVCLFCALQYVAQTAAKLNSSTRSNQSCQLDGWRSWTSIQKSMSCRKQSHCLKYHMFLHDWTVGGLSASQSDCPLVVCATFLREIKALFLWMRATWNFPSPFTIRHRF